MQRYLFLVIPAILNKPVSKLHSVATIHFIVYPSDPDSSSQDCNVVVNIFSLWTHVVNKAMLWHLTQCCPLSLCVCASVSAGKCPLEKQTPLWQIRKERDGEALVSFRRCMCPWHKVYQWWVDIWQWASINNFIVKIKCLVSHLSGKNATNSPDSDSLIHVKHNLVM